MTTLPYNVRSRHTTTWLSLILLAAILTAATFAPALDVPISDHAQSRHGGDRCTPDEIKAFMDANPGLVDVYVCPRETGAVQLRVALMGDNRIGLRFLNGDGTLELTCFEPKSTHYKDNQQRAGFQWCGTLEKLLRGG